MAYTVYKHTSPNGKVYIGITGANPENRWQKGHGYRNNRHFTFAIARYGWENFKHEILYDSLTKEEAEKIEQELIRSYKSNDQRFGYNVASGGKSSSGYKHTEDEKRRIANSLKGVPHTAERRRKLSEATKRSWKNPDYRRHMVEVHIGKQAGSDHPMSKAVIQYDVDGKVVAKYGSLSEAQQKTGIAHQQISACCNGKQKICHGYIWRFE